MVSAVDSQGCCFSCLTNIETNPIQPIELSVFPEKPLIPLPKQICGEIFNSKLTCCNPVQTHQYALQWMELMNQNYQKMLSNSLKFKIQLKKLTKIRNLVESKFDNWLETSNPTSLPPTAAADLYLTPETKTDWLAILDKFDGFQERRINEQEAIAKQELEHCFVTMASYRINGLCLRCSSAGEEFYFSGTNSYAISRSNCLDMTSACLPVFNYMANMTTFYNMIWRIKKYDSQIFDKRFKTKGFSNSELDRLQGMMDKWEVFQDQENFNFEDQGLMDDLSFFCGLLPLNGVNQDFEAFDRMLDKSARIADLIIDAADGAHPNFNDVSTDGANEPELGSYWDDSENSVMLPAPAGVDLKGDFWAKSFVVINQDYVNEEQSKLIFLGILLGLAIFLN
jgi:hypothetical protein